MKINVIGNIINLKKVYRISALRPPNEWEFDDSGDSGDDETDWMYSFEIRFLNKKGMRFSSNDRGEIKDLREQIIKYWNKSKPISIELYPNSHNIYID